MYSPTKKTLTEDVHTSQNAANQAPNTYISDDLAAALRSRGSRVRKSVMEGYSTTRTIDASIGDPSSVSPIFRSARDINQAVFKPGTVSPFCSPKKRGRVDYEGTADESDASQDVDVEMHDIVAEPSKADAISVGKPGGTVGRPTKPLPRLKLNSKAPKYPHMAHDQPTPHVDSLQPGGDPFL